MKRNTTRLRRLGSAVIALAAVAVIGAAPIAPASAEWRERHNGVGFGFSIGAPAYGYYPYPSYPAYPAYPAYGYPYYYGGYSPYYYGGPSVSVDIGR